VREQVERQRPGAMKKTQIRWPVRHPVRDLVALANAAIGGQLDASCVTERRS